jgi:signal transduction histidine kinase
MLEFFQDLFSSSGFMPHGHCYFWRPEIVWLHVVSDSIITLAYASIPLTLWYFSRRRTDLPFHWIFVAFGVFIFSCGATHLMEIVTIWQPYYRLAGIVKAITAAASIATAFGLVRIIPQALALRSATELEALNRRLQIAETDLHQRIVDLTAANQELEAFSYTVSHDLRAPLRAIDGFSQVVVEDCQGKLEPELLGYLGRIRANTQNMGRLIDDLLALSQLGRKKLEPEAVDLRELTATLVEELKITAQKPATRFVVDGLPSAVRGDHLLLRQALYNLIGNAVKYSSIRDEPRIEVSARRDEAAKAWEISVSDNGVGFDEKYANKLFKVFERLHAGDDRFEGTGIGLSIVARIVRRHGGLVGARGRPNEGATFFFTLPDPQSAETV